MALGGAGRDAHAAPVAAVAGTAFCSSPWSSSTPRSSNIVERPDGIKIAAWFIATIIVTSLISRVLRSTELRVHARRARRERAAFHPAKAAGGADPDHRQSAGYRPAGEYEHKLREARESHHLPPDEPVLFLEVRPGDVSEFSDVLQVQGVDVGGTASCAA